VSAIAERSPALRVSLAGRAHAAIAPAARMNAAIAGRVARERGEQGMRVNGRDEWCALGLPLQDKL
jgi:hypothetical protein